MRRLEAHFTGTPEWHAARRKSVGASEAAAILGLGNQAYGGAATVWAGKLSDEPRELDERGKQLTAMGHACERPILELAGMVLAANIHWGEMLGQLAHDDTERLTCHLDGYIAGDDGTLTPVEAKWTQAHDAADQWTALAQWIEGGALGDDYPLAIAGKALEGYYVQVQAQIAITGASEGYLVGVIGWDAAARLLAGLPLLDGEFRCVLIPRDDVLCARLPKAAAGFWARHVETREPPTVVAADLDAMRRARREEGEILTDDAEIARALDELEAAKAGLKEAGAPFEELIATCQVRVEAAMLAASATTLRCGAWTVERKLQARKATAATTYYVTRFKRAKGGE